MHHAYLPKRKSGKGRIFPDPQADGVWDERPTQLGHLAASIEIPSGPQRIYSIPDPWARALLFDRALYDIDHKLHLPVLGEWRGLLAILGLRERRNFESLTVKDVKPEAGELNSFSSVLAELMPKDEHMLSKESDWRRFHLFLWRLRPFEHNSARAFGFTSPMTLVATGADYAGKISPEEVPWFDGSQLHDPVEWLSEREAEALAEWLLMISAAISRLNVKTSRQSDLIQRIGDFARSLDETAQAPAKPEDILSTKLAIGLDHGVFSTMDKPLRGESAAISDVQIVTTKPDAPVYYLIEPSLSQQWHQNAKEIVIYGDVNLATSDRYTRSGATQGQLQDGQFWCTAGFFFQDRLIYLQAGAAPFPGCMPVVVAGDSRKRSVAFPLTEDALRLFTPKELQESFSVSWQPAGGATCSLRLRLKTSKGRELVARIERKYSEAEMVLVEDLPLVSIWPDFRVDTPKWQTYYTFQMWGAKTTAHELEVRPWSDEERQPDASRALKLEDRDFQLTLTKTYPEALICSTPHVDLDSHRQVSARGLLLVNRPEMQSPRPANKVTLGVDFGSTGSGIYIRSGDKPEPLLFKNRLCQITGYDSAQFDRFTRQFFVPSQMGSITEILSLFQDFGDTKDGPRARLPLRDGHVLYLVDPKDLFLGERWRIKSNLKWGDEREKIAARDFLKQLCLQAAAEIAVDGWKVVDLRYSYPTAFSDPDIANLDSTWEEIVTYLDERTGIEFAVTPPYRDPASGEETPADHREAIAATKFFCDEANEGEQMDISGGAVTVDIGGGTTDMAIWNHSTLVSHSSVVFAGRDIFLSVLRASPGILNEIDSRVDIGALKSNQDSAFDANLDAIISKHGNDLIRGLGDKSSEPRIEGFLSILETGLCGIGYYAGLLVRRVIEGGAFKPGRRIVVFAGGNGSKIFLWCAFGKLSERSDIHRRFTKAFLTGAGIGPAGTRVGIQLSTKPKSEVAYGLVCKSLPLTIDEHFAKPLAGEKFLVGERRMKETADEKKGGGKDAPGSWDSAPTAEQIRKGEIKADRYFPMFRQFLEVMDEATEGDAFEDMLDQLGGRVDIRLSHLAMDVAAVQLKDRKKRKDENLLRNEPIFIIALKAYLAMRIKDWAGHG